MSVRTKALLLNSAALRESDLLAVLFTEKLGKVRALAKGALRSKKRFLGSMLNLNELQIELAPLKGGDIDFRLENADLIHSRFDLAQDPERLGCAYTLAELVERTSPELSAEPELYRLLADGITNIAGRKNFREYFFYCLFNIMRNLGYPPSLETCAICGQKLGTRMKNYLFSIERGGFVEETHAGLKKGMVHVAPSLAQTLMAISRAGAKGTIRVRLSERDWTAGVKLFLEFTAWHLEKPLLSLFFLRNFSSPK
jgi:DNA repair protein RecO (recombination protein O)